RGTAPHSTRRLHEPSFDDEPLARHRGPRRRGRPRSRRLGPGADGRQAHDQGAEDDHGPHGQEQPREVLRRRRARQKRLRRGSALLRGPVQPRPRQGVVRAAAEGRLREDRGRQDAGVVTVAAPTRSRAPIPAAAGIGLRFQHHRAVLDERPAAAWLEVHPENYPGGGTPPAYLAGLRRDYPVSLHGVALSLGSAEGLDERHLARLKRLAERVEPGLVSEHLAWTATGGTHFADLLPLPYTEEALAVVWRNVERAQDFL